LGVPLAGFSFPRSSLSAGIGGLLRRKIWRINFDMRSFGEFLYLLVFTGNLPRAAQMNFS